MEEGGGRRGGEGGGGRRFYIFLFFGGDEGALFVGGTADGLRFSMLFAGRDAKV